MLFLKVCSPNSLSKKIQSSSTIIGLQGIEGCVEAICNAYVQNFTSWVCRSYETPDIERECCLCPVKGENFTHALKFIHLRGALMPIDVEPLWVHVTCAWFRPEVCFASDEKWSLHSEF
ncbi:putative [histone H3]-lysine(4) N-trimethyltransferase [Helianthus anomalus]